MVAISEARAALRRSAVIALATAWALAVVPTWTKIHEATVQHVRCAEHGAVMEVATVGFSATPVAWDLPRYASDGDESHDHACGFHALLRSSAHQTAAMGVIADAVSFRSVGFAPRIAVSSQDRWRLAPKLSPPII